MSQNLTTHELDSPPWLRVESTLMATARLVRTAFDARLEPARRQPHAGQPARLHRRVRIDHPDPTGRPARHRPGLDRRRRRPARGPPPGRPPAQSRRPARVARGDHAGRQRARRRDRGRRRGTAGGTPARHRTRGAPGPRLGDDPPATEPAVRHRQSARSVRPFITHRTTEQQERTMTDRRHRRRRPHRRAASATGSSRAGTPPTSPPRCSRPSTSATTSTPPSSTT